MKFVLDTNVLISGFITTAGPSAYILSKIFRRHQVIISDYILEEFEQKMTVKLKFPKQEVRRAVAYLKRRTLLAPTKEAFKIHFPDKGDIPILQMVEFMKPHYLVTGDKKLLALKRTGKTLIITPREAMEMV